MTTKFIVLAAALAAAVVGCSEKVEDEGPMEKAGKQVDQTVEQATSYASDQLKAAREAVESANKNLESKDKAMTEAGNN